MPQGIGNVPIVIFFLGSVEDPRRADIEQRDIEIVRNMNGVLNGQGVGHVGVFRVPLAIFQVGIGAQMEEIVRLEIYDLAPVGIGVTEIERR